MKMIFVKPIIFMVFVAFNGCIYSGNKPNKCRWAHTQVIGHIMLKGKNIKNPSVYLAIKCANKINMQKCILFNDKDSIKLDSLYQKNNYYIFSANIKQIDNFLGVKIRDSVKYKKILNERLAKWKLFLNDQEILKADDYKIKFGYDYIKQEG